MIAKFSEIICKKYAKLKFLYLGVIIAKFCKITL